jgi:hypothetical protein
LCFSFLLFSPSCVVSFFPSFSQCPLFTLSLYSVSSVRVFSYPDLPLLYSN